MVLIIEQLKSLFENSVSWIKSTTETYAYQLDILKEELECKKWIINKLAETIGKHSTAKPVPDIQPVPLFRSKWRK